MVDAWDLGSHGDTRESSNLSARTNCQSRRHGAPEDRRCQGEKIGDRCSVSRILEPAQLAARRLAVV